MIAEPERPWDEPGAVAVAPGVHRIPLPLHDESLHAVNVYVLEGEDGLTLIDSGEAGTASASALAAALRQLGHGLEDVRDVLVTHVHRDHYTLAVALRQEFGTAVHLGRSEEASLRLSADATRHSLATQFAMIAECGAADLAVEIARDDEPLPASAWEDPDVWLDEGQLKVGARLLDAIATPGHTRGHLVFRDEAGGLLFAGDHVLPHITPSVGLEPASVSLPLRDYIHSLRLVRALPDTQLLPAHGQVSPSVHDRVDDLLRHHEARLEAIARLVHGEHSTAHDVATRLTWTRRKSNLDQLSRFNRMLATLETKAHLDVLAAQGLLHTQLDHDRVRLYWTEP
ncbi:MBL fold metallo-hydrolase [Rhodococcus jostii]|uniref:MBL fold metallo-hydrolase n=1 Tax=Rhodococcus jostii TaxID=132919 RepID=UPI00365FA4FF